MKFSQRDCEICGLPITYEYTIIRRSRKPLEERGEPITTCSKPCATALRQRIYRANKKAALEKPKRKK